MRLCLLSSLVSVGLIIWNLSDNLWLLDSIVNEHDVYHYAFVCDLSEQILPTLSSISISGCSKIGPKWVRCVWVFPPYSTCSYSSSGCRCQNSSSVKQQTRQIFIFRWTKWTTICIWWLFKLGRLDGISATGNNSFHWYCVPFMPSITLHHRISLTLLNVPYVNYKYECQTYRWLS